MDRSFDVKQAALSKEGKICTAVRFRMKVLRKAWKVAIMGCSVTMMEYVAVRACERWLTANEELSMDLAHVFGHVLCQVQLDFCRQQWLLRGGVQRGGKEYAKTIFKK